MFHKLPKEVRLPKGFTLVEFLVIAGILGVVAAAIIFLIRPQTQFAKVEDAQRQQDLNQIRSALELYYEDHKCYPTSLSFGSEWTEGETTYMKKIPQDPKHPTSAYVYEVPPVSCPQWSVVFAKLTREPAPEPACSLIPQNCLPAKYDKSWACQVSGEVDCAVLAPTPTPAPTAGPTPTSGPTPTPGGPTPTPTSAPTPSPTIPSGRETYFIRTNEFPQMSQVDFDPFNPSVGQTQTITVQARDKSPISSISVRMVRDGTASTVALSLKNFFVEGDFRYETWSGSWTVVGTINNVYRAEITARGATSTSSTAIIVR